MLTLTRYGTGPNFFSTSSVHRQERPTCGAAPEKASQIYPRLQELLEQLTWIDDLCAECRRLEITQESAKCGEQAMDVLNAALVRTISSPEIAFDCLVQEVLSGLDERVSPILLHADVRALPAVWDDSAIVCWWLALLAISTSNGAKRNGHIPQLNVRLDKAADQWHLSIAEDAGASLARSVMRHHIPLYAVKERLKAAQVAKSGPWGSAVLLTYRRSHATATELPDAQPAH